MNAGRLALVLEYANALHDRVLERRRQSPGMQTVNAGVYLADWLRR